MTIDLAAILRWCWDAILGVMKSAHGGAALLGIAIGVALAEFLAHMLPPGMDSYLADRITRLVCLGVSMCVTFALDATLTGFFLASLAGLAGPTIHQTLQRWLFLRLGIVPKAMVDSCGNLDTAPKKEAK